MNDEKPDHSHCSPSSGDLLVKIVDVLGQDDVDDDVTCCHTDSTNDQHWLSTNLIDPENSRDCGKLLKLVNILRRVATKCNLQT